MLFACIKNPSQLKNALIRLRKIHTYIMVETFSPNMEYHNFSQSKSSKILIFILKNIFTSISFQGYNSNDKQTPFTDSNI